MQPQIDILIAAYNVKGYIEKTLESVFAQTYENIHVIIGDDESTDGTLEYLRSIAAEHSNVELLELKHAGLINVRRQTIAKSTAPYTMMLDGDDYLTPNCLEVLYNHLAANNLDISIGDYYRQSPNYTLEVKQNYEGNIQGDEYIHKILTAEITSYVWGRLYKREFLEGLIFPLEIHHSEDRLINLQVALKNPLVGYIHTPVCYYVKRIGSLAHVVMPLDYVKTLTGCIESILNARSDLQPWIVTMRFGFLLLNINSSKSPDVSHDPWVKELYAALQIPANLQILKAKMPLADRMYISLYQHRATHGLAHLLRTVIRIYKSLQKRIVSLLSPKSK